MIVAVMPAYNEEKTVGSVVKGALQHAGKVIVVDDCSSDRTSAAAKRAGALVVRHEVNRGLGASLRTGFGRALAMNADIILTIDADGQHAPQDIPKFISRIAAGYDFVLGERNLSKYPFVKKFGNFFLNMATNFISGTDLKDTESGFRAFTRNSLRKLHLRASRYEIAGEIIFEVGRNNLRTANVPIIIPVYVRGVGVFDGLKNFSYLLRRRRRTWFDYLRDAMYVLRKTYKKYVG